MHDYWKTGLILLVTAVLAGCYTAESERERYVRLVTAKCEAQGKQFVLGDVQQEGIPHLTRFTTSVTGYCIDKTFDEYCPKGKQTYILDLDQRNVGARVRFKCLDPNQLVRIPIPFGVETFATAVINGAQILKVMPGSIAERAGIKLDDVIYEFDGQPIATAGDLQAAVARARAGQQVLVRFRRDEKEESAAAQF